MPLSTKLLIIGVCISISLIPITLGIIVFCIKKRRQQRLANYRAEVPSNQVVIELLQHAARDRDNQDL